MRVRCPCSQEGLLAYFLPPCLYSASRIDRSSQSALYEHKNLYMHVHMCMNMNLHMRMCMCMCMCMHIWLELRRLSQFKVWPE